MAFVSYRDTFCIPSTVPCIYAFQINFLVLLFLHFISETFGYTWPDCFLKIFEGCVLSLKSETFGTSVPGTPLAIP